MISFSTILLFGIFSGFSLFSIWPLLLDKINNDQYDNDTLNDLERRKSILSSVLIFSKVVIPSEKLI